MKFRMDEDIEDVTERLPIVNELILHYQKCHYIHGSDPHNHGVEYTYSSGYKKFLFCLHSNV